MPEIYWQQERQEEIDSWEFQRSTDTRDWSWVDVSDASQCETCFTALIFEEVNSPYYRARSISTTGEVSDWSNTITLPEPRQDVMLLVSFICLLLVYYFTRRL